MRYFNSRSKCWTLCPQCQTFGRRLENRVKNGNVLKFPDFSLCVDIIKLNHLLA